jgi:hypothetical protein
MDLPAPDFPAIRKCLNALQRTVRPRVRDSIPDKDRDQLRKKLLDEGRRLAGLVSMDSKADPPQRYFERRRFEEKTGEALLPLWKFIALGGDGWPAHVLARTEARTEFRALLRAARAAVGQPLGRKATNKDRDAWVARLRERKNPVPWEEIRKRLLKVGPAKGWNMPNDPKALEEAYRRRLKKQRTAG